MGNLQTTQYNRFNQNLLTLQTKYHFKRQQLDIFYSVFAQGLTKTNQSHFPFTSFSSVFHESDSLYLSHLLSTHSVERVGHCNFAEFINIVTQFCLLNEKELVQLAFEALDRNKSGLIEEEDLQILVYSLQAPTLQRTASALSLSASQAPSNTVTPFNNTQTNNSQQSDLVALHPSELLRVFREIDCDSLSLCDFHELHLRRPQLLWPLFRLQFRWQERTLGMKEWRNWKQKIKEAERDKRYGAKPKRFLCFQYGVEQPIERALTPAEIEEKKAAEAAELKKWKEEQIQQRRAIKLYKKYGHRRRKSNLTYDEIAELLSPTNARASLPGQVTEPDANNNNNKHDEDDDERSVNFAKAQDDDDDEREFGEKKKNQLTIEQIIELKILQKKKEYEARDCLFSPDNALSPARSPFTPAGGLVRSGSSITGLAPCSLPAGVNLSAQQEERRQNVFLLANQIHDGLHKNEKELEIERQEQRKREKKERKKNKMIEMQAKQVKLPARLMAQHI